MTNLVEVPDRLWQRAEKLAQQGFSASAEQLFLSAAETFIAYLEDRSVSESELNAADIWEAARPENVQRWWYNLSQRSLAAVWEHPDENVYTLNDGELA